jgi:hypothetical protein
MKRILDEKIGLAKGVYLVIVQREYDEVIGILGAGTEDGCRDLGCDYRKWRVEIPDRQ